MKAFVTKFHPKDALKIKLRERDARDTEGMSPLAWAFIFDSFGEAKTLMLENGDIVACGGCVQNFGGGVADFWALTSDHIREYWKSFAVACRDGINDFIEKHGLHRVQAYTLALDDGGKDPELDRFMTWLGFEWEGLLRKTGPNALDRHLYARVTK